MRRLGMPQAAKTLGELPGVNADRARRRAQAIDGAGIQGHVWKMAFKVGEQVGVVLTFVQPRHFAANYNALARRGGQLATRALRLAVAALDALIDLRLDHWHALQVMQVGVTIGIDDDAGI